MDLIKKVLEAIDFHIPTAIITLVVIVLVYFAFVGIMKTFKNGDNE